MKNTAGARILLAAVSFAAPIFLYAIMKYFGVGTIQGLVIPGAAVLTALFALVVHYNMQVPKE